MYAGASRPISRYVFVLLLAMGVSLPVVSATGNGDALPEATTTSDPRVPSEELALLLNPLSKDELLIEAEGWRSIVRAKAEEIARAEIAISRQNRQIAKAEGIEAKAQAAKEQLTEAAARLDEARATGDAGKILEAQQTASEAGDDLQDVNHLVDETLETVRQTDGTASKPSPGTVEKLDASSEAAKTAAEAVADVAAAATVDDGVSEEIIREAADEVQGSVEEAKQATEAVQEKVAETLAGAMADAEEAAELDGAAAKLERAEQLKEEEKLNLLDKVTVLREERTLLVDNMRTVIDELRIKTDKDDKDTLAKIRDYELYLSSVSGIHVDVTDTTSAWVTLKGWVTSHEGGIRWAKNIGSFFGILLVAWFLSRLLGGAMRKATGRLALPALLAEFLSNSIRWVVMLVGIIWALSALEVSIAPLLAMVGAAGFIIAFAMQDSLSNFASGLMILFFRPFDMGDFVEAGGVSGKVSSVNLVSTTIRTADNKLMVVPNSRIWSDVITNVTGVSRRRVDMEFGIGYDDDVEEAQRILEEIVSDDPRVLKDPAPNIRLSALADSSVNFICRPWTSPEDYWDVYWDITKEVKKRFDAAGIGIPYPQQDVHLHIPDGGFGDRIAAPSSGQEQADKPDG